MAGKRAMEDVAGAQLVNLNMTRKVRARSSLFFHKSFLARGFDVSPPVPTTGRAR